MMRINPSTRTTMAEMNNINGDGDGGTGGHARQPVPIMLHKTCTEQQLDDEYPPLTVPDDDDRDYDEGDEDRVLKEGKKQDSRRHHGRREGARKKKESWRSCWQGREM